MFGAGLRGKHPVATVVAVVHDPLLGGNLGAPHEGREHLLHLLCHIENDECLVAVAGCAVDFRRLLIISVEQIQATAAASSDLPCFLSIST